MESLVHERCATLIDNNRPVEILGYQNKENAAKLISWTDYLVIPSRVESIPVILSDALQLDKPVIATPAGDIPEILEENNLGLLCTSISADSISSAIKLAIQISPKSFNNDIQLAKSIFNIQSIAQQLYNDIKNIK